MDWFTGRTTLLLFIVAVIAGLLVSWLAYKIFKLALFINGFALGVLIGLPVGYHLFPSWPYLAAVILGLAFGLIFVAAHKSIIMLSMALIGSFLTVYGFAYFAGHTYLEDLFTADNLEEVMQALHAFGKAPFLMFLASILGATGVLTQCNKAGGTKPST